MVLRWCVLHAVFLLGFYLTVVPGSCGKKGDALAFTSPATYVQGGYGRVVMWYVNWVGRIADMPYGVSPYDSQLRGFRG